MTSVTNATNAAASQTAAGLSATSATNSATTATTQAGIATTKATDAGTSAASAAGSAMTSVTNATNAAASQTAAGLSATSATNSASTATTQAGIATTKATAAGTSATSAAGSATTSATNATNAAASQTAAGISATAANVSATTASAQAVISTTQAGNAAASASNSLTNANTAGASATSAAGSATAAAASSTTATNQASIAAGHATDAAASVTTVSSAVATVAGAAASYTINVDSNHNVAGIQLISSGPTGAATSAFNIRADKFSVALPGYSATPVLTVQNVNGTPTLAFNGAIIGDGTLVTNAIALGAVTTNSFGHGVANSGLIWAAGVIGTCILLQINYDGNDGFFDSGAGVSGLWLEVNGTNQGYWLLSNNGAAPALAALNRVQLPPCSVLFPYYPGSNGAVSFRAYVTTGAWNAAHTLTGTVSIFVLGLKR